jgi:multiple sugar transport system ATP-binding protein
VDTPQRLYEAPANLFVAAFIGTPPMNLLAARTAGSDGQLSLTVGDQQLPLTEATFRRYPGARNLRDRDVVLGIRADDLHYAPTRPELPTITARLELLEALGSQTIAYFRTEMDAVRPAVDLAEPEPEEIEESAEGVTAARPNLVAALPAADALELKIEDQIRVAVDVGKVHLFDAESGEPLR